MRRMFQRCVNAFRREALLMGSHGDQGSQSPEREEVVEVGRVDPVGPPLKYGFYPKYDKKLSRCPELG